MCRHICFSGCYLFRGGFAGPSLAAAVTPGVLTEVGGGLGVDSLFILLLDIKHLFLTRPVASIGNMFPLPNMQILALFAQFCECFLNLDDCITREDHDHSFTLLKLCLRTYNLINTENPQ